MTDAKGLSEVERAQHDRDHMSRMYALAMAERNVLRDENAALAERLKQAECNQELVELYWQREQKAIKERDQLTADLRVMKQERDTYQRERDFDQACTIPDLIDQLDRLNAELARMKADPEILVRWQAAEAQRTWEGTQS